MGLIVLLGLGTAALWLAPTSQDVVVRIPTETTVDSLASPLGMHLADLGIPRVDPGTVRTLGSLDIDLDENAVPRPLELTPPEEIPHVDMAGRMRVLGEYFEQRYEGATLDELVVAKSRSETAVYRMMDDAVNARFEAGLAEESIEAKQESYEAAMAASPPSPSDGLVRSRRTEGLPGGTHVLVRRTTLPWEEHKELYDTQDELSWLMREIKKRMKAELGQDG